MTLEITGTAGRLHVDDGGDGGLPVVFVHSFGGDASHWSEQLAHLRPTRRAIAFDLRAHGRSAATDDLDSYTIGDLADDLGAVVDGLGVERFALVGHSIGGSTAIAYAGGHPDRVAGMLLVGTPGHVPPEQADGIMSAMTADYETTMASYWDKLVAEASPAVKARVASERGRMAEPIAMALLGATFADDPIPALRAYDGPVMTVTVGDSPYDLHAQAPDLPDERMTWTSHWPQLDDPVGFDRILDAFLARVDAVEAVASSRTREPAATR